MCTSLCVRVRVCASVCCLCVCCLCVRVCHLGSGERVLGWLHMVKHTLTPH